MTPEVPVDERPIDEGVGAWAEDIDLAVAKVEHGEWSKKSGKGFYDYASKA